eukprot:1471674-Amphidinium_carterae.1
METRGLGSVDVHSWSYKVLRLACHLQGMESNYSNARLRIVSQSTESAALETNAHIAPSHRRSVQSLCSSSLRQVIRRMTICVASDRSVGTIWTKSRVRCASDGTATSTAH